MCLVTNFKGLLLYPSPPAVLEDIDQYLIYSGFSICQTKAGKTFEIIKSETVSTQLQGIEMIVASVLWRLGLGSVLQLGSVRLLILHLHPGLRYRTVL